MHINKWQRATQLGQAVRRLLIKSALKIGMKLANNILDVKLIIQHIHTGGKEQLHIKESHAD